MRKEDLTKAIAILKGCEDAPICVIQKLQEIVDDPENGPDVSLIDRGHYFASILWQEEDIRSELRERGYECSKENVAEVLNYLDVEGMEDCGHGWGFIYEAIDKAEKESLLVPGNPN